MDSASAGRRLREIRLEQGVKQADLARRLGISPAYLNLLEKGRRAMQFPLLMRALESMAVNVEGFMASLGEAHPDHVLAALLDDPLAYTLELDAAELAGTRLEPRVATTIATLFNLYKNARAQLDTAMSQLEAGDPPRFDYAPGDEVTDFLQHHRNYFPELEEEAQRVRRLWRLPDRFLSDQLIPHVSEQLGLAVAVETARPDSTVVRRYNPEAGRVVLSAELSDHTRKFELGHVLGLRFLDESRLHERLVAERPPRHAETVGLIKIHLANYFAGALLLPYEELFAAAQETRYDVEKLGRRFGGSYEAVAHRMCNLSDPRRLGVPLHFLRVNVAGNISKRYAGSGIRFPQGHGTCPKWAVHNAFLTPAIITRQLSMMPDGSSYFCFAKVISEPHRGSLVHGTNYVIGLGCAADDAHHFVYADALPGLDRERARTAIPVGVSCRFCERTDCNQRAAPSYKFAFAVNEYEKKANFFSPHTRE